MNKNIIFLVLLIFLNQCGYSPIYKGSTKSDINIKIINIEGDKEFNNKINSNIRKYYNNNSEKSYSISIKSKIEKNTIAKDNKGKITNYEIIAIVAFEINHNGEKNNFTLRESLKIINNDDSFEQRKYENVIKNNFASSIIEKLVIKLNTLK